MVNSLLNVSKIESGKIEISPTLCDPTEIFSNVLVDLKIEAEKGEKKLSVNNAKNVPKINVDADLIKHVYSNLVSNAIRYTKNGGKIAVRTYVSKSNVIIEVKDNGIGIPKNEQERIFEKFFRASNALKKETDGSGLGLYLSKIIVESSGGKMGYKSNENEGSTFWFSLPIKSKKVKGKML